MMSRSDAGTLLITAIRQLSADDGAGAIVATVIQAPGAVTEIGVA